VIVIVASLVLFLVGLYAIYAILTKRNMIKVAVGVALMEYAVNFLFAIVGFRPKAIPPIMTKVVTDTVYSDPLPQALVLTAIVIGLGVTAFMLSLALRLYKRIGSFDLADIQKLKG